MPSTSISVALQKFPFLANVSDSRRFTAERKVYTRTCPSHGAGPGLTRKKRGKETRKNSGCTYHRSLSYEVSGCKSAGLCPRLMAVHKVDQSRMKYVVNKLRSFSHNDVRERKRARAA